MEPATEQGGWPLRHAHMFGADDVPVQSDIRVAEVRKGRGGVSLIRCEKRSGESAGLSLQFPVTIEGGSVGSVVILQTCLLPERERPYLLSLELARHRLMLVLNKLEDWAMFDLPANDPAMQMFEQARRAFTEALVAHAEGGGGGGRNAGAGEVPYTAEADRLARRALALAVTAGEMLTQAQARAQFAKRMSGELASAAARIAAPPNAITNHEAAESRSALLGTVGVILPTPPQIGVSINPEVFGPAMQKAVALCADFVCMPMRWVDMEPTEGKYLFGKTDRWIEWAVRQARLPIVGGPIVDFRKGCVPEWLYIWEHDYETLRELVYEHVKNLVTRYRRTVGTWTVVSGLHVASNFALSFEQVMDLTRLVVMVVRKLQPGAKVQVQIDQPWGEYFADSTRAVPPLMYAEMVGQAGVNPDLFALRVEMGQPEQGRGTRDLMAFSAMLDRFAALEKPLSIAAISAPSRPADADSMGLDAQMDPGYWRAPWSPQTQVEWMTAFLGVAASKPYVHSVCWHELYEPAKPAPADSKFDGLVDASGHSKPSLWRLAEIRQAMRNRQSPLGLPAMPAVGSL
ncbi:MAG: endo-1,4-beta-xylanase [Phycisphaerales bacterium]|nr:endo-1,4-beta-xylanase [Phycisphaerales bacterium]